MFKTNIQIKGKLDVKWLDWFDELQVQSDASGNSLLCGNLPDKSAVYGVISRLSSLGIVLISMTCQEINNSQKPEK